MKTSGVHIWCDKEYAVYVNRYMAAVHAAEDGKCRLYLPAKKQITPLLPAGKTFYASEIELELQSGDTAIFRLD
jgi:hypothetical protein